MNVQWDLYTSLKVYKNMHNLTELVHPKMYIVNNCLFQTPETIIHLWNTSGNILDSFWFYIDSKGPAVPAHLKSRKILKTSSKKRVFNRNIINVTRILFCAHKNKKAYGLFWGSFLVHLGPLLYISKYLHLCSSKQRTNKGLWGLEQHKASNYWHHFNFGWTVPLTFCANL